MFSSLLRRTGMGILACILASAVQAEELDPNTCNYVKAASTSLRYSGDTLGIAMDGKINGTPAVLLVDTSTWTTMLTSAAAESRGIRLWPTHRYSTGPGGNVHMFNARVGQFVAGPVSSTNLDMAVLGNFESPLSYDGIIGAPFLLQTDLEFNLAEKKLNFFRAYNCKNTHLAYWNANAVVIPFARNAARSPNPRFPVLLNGKEFTAVIDSGAPYSRISRDAAEAIGLDLNGPGVEKLSDARAYGDTRIPRWAATVDKLEIANETITHARFGVLDARLNADVMLGADFLRSHRVLFAMSQNKVYISYLGGQPLGFTKRIEPWLLKEADEGNADAQLALAKRYYHGYGVARDEAIGNRWLSKAAASGSTEAMLAIGESLLAAERFAPATAQLRKALEKRPGDRYTALLLHAARLGDNVGELGRGELAQAFSRDDDKWPGQIARYYLGKISKDQLLEEARADREKAGARTCLALQHIAAQLRATGDQEGMKAAQAQRNACMAPPKTS